MCVQHPEMFNDSENITHFLVIEGK